MAVPGILNAPDTIDGTVPALTINILGLLEVSISHHPVRLRPMQALLVLALLFTDGYTLPADRLQRLVFDREPDMRTADLLRTYVHQIRQAFAHAGTGAAHTTWLLETIQPGGRTLYRLNIEPEQVDAFHFEALEVAGRTALRQARFAEAATHFGRAARLFRGDALPGVRERPFIRGRIARYADLRRNVVAGHLEARICLDRFHEVIPQLRALIETYPADGWLWCLYIISLELDGRFTDAALACKLAIEAMTNTAGLDDNRLRVLQQMVLKRTLPLDGTLAVTTIRSVRP